MVETIRDENDNVLAIIVKSSFSKEGIEFFTPNDFSQQLGYMNRPKGYSIQPHFHKLHSREVTLTQEVLLVKSGKVKVNFFNQTNNHIDSRVIMTGDIILLASGGHGFEMLEQSEIFEVKQGPYMGDEDKVRF